MSKEEKTFVISGEATFEAQDIDDALSKLSVHFRRLGAGEDSDLFNPPTHITIRKLEGEVVQ